MRKWLLAVGVVILGSSSVLLAKDSLKDALEDFLVSDDWIYEDIDAGYAEAKKSGKPLLVSFRCVP
jgi:hypothetical protein